MKDEYDSTPLHEVAYNDHSDIAKLLVNTGSDKEAKDMLDNTPQLIAKVFGYTGIVKLLE